MEKNHHFVLPTVAFLVAAIITILMLRASVNYRIMSYTEKVKNQIEEEQKVYSDTIFKEVTVLRPWYSLDPTRWTYYVLLTDDEDVLVYKYADGVFYQVDQKKASS